MKATKRKRKATTCCPKQSLWRRILVSLSKPLVCAKQFIGKVCSDQPCKEQIVVLLVLVFTMVIMFVVQERQYNADLLQLINEINAK